MKAENRGAGSFISDYGNHQIEVEIIGMNVGATSYLLGTNDKSTQFWSMRLNPHNVSYYALAQQSKDIDKYEFGWWLSANQFRTAVRPRK